MFLLLMSNNFKKRFKKMVDYEVFKALMQEEEETFNDDYDNYTDLMREFEGK